MCNCDYFCHLINSRTPNNSGRRFFSCKIPKDNGGCGYFTWIDSSLEAELLKQMIKKVEEERDTLKHKLKEIGDKITALKQKSEGN
ncbi:hypothetical protein K7X08_011510 [Anisodus acutangulus]|uniref:GRF-type domain-containing protein n=1 Tax=Anisodus acutangulus TaxID=402998 RepID=A0A9Q1RLD1_9SOLA|nr:hypothetical protein K7X08_011510 [Anisodus acutangulus]